MQNVIVGTAGHVDHGKTCLIKALSGIDTDRLKEEKKRGITIELGFANLIDTDGVHIGIIDVPGHEKFVKNMLAGIGGIDLVLLVVALDEGVMPQTVEHFEILKMLQIRQGIVVLTKSDTVDSDWADMVEEDVRELIKGSFLEQAEMIRVSSYTGENIDVLRQKIIAMAKQAGRRREEKELFRLPIDRVFTMGGFGTVVTGTLVEGMCEAGEEVMVYPQERLLKIRGVQSHGQKEEKACAGQRTAINLAGIKKEELSRGEVLAYPGSLVNSTMVDATLRLFDSTQRKLKNGDRVHLSYGSAQAIGKVILLDCDVVEAGQEALVQLRFDDPVCVKRNDKFIIRFYSPVETFGGGTVLNPAADKHKRGQEEVIESLRLKKTGTDMEILEQMVNEESRRFPEAKDLAAWMDLTVSEAEKMLDTLRNKKKILHLNDGSFVGKAYWEKVSELANQVLAHFHRENPIVEGMDREELKSRLAERMHLKSGKKGEALIAELEKRKVITIQGSVVSVAGFTVSYSNEASQMMTDMENIYKKAGIEVPSTDELVGAYKDRKQARQVLSELTKKGILVKAGTGVLMHREHWDRALNILREHLAANPQITLGEFRDLLGTSRKYAVMLLETYDQMKITKKTGDARVPGGK
ncbi:MAG: selenocysteine-specific translation elongation factor [Clostridium sp.]|nr:selenocysteine-specific translation elongation factor [Clostridium sp.]